MPRYDAIIVLGSLPDPETWKFPQQIYQCLDKAKELLDDNQAPYIITSGKWSVSFDNRHIQQPFLECDALADYLLQKGVPANKILREGESKDTISNLYYMKTQYFIPRRAHSLLFVVASFRIPRLTFLCERILGAGYNVDFVSIAAEPSGSYNEPNTFKVQEEFLRPMKNGDHAWLQDKFYSAPIYQYWAQRDRKPH